MDLEVIIGMEVHIQMNTKTKMFCACDNDSFGKEPNTNICPVCMGFPGQLPVLNEEALKKGVIAALALNCKINNFSRFDRKQYFYPDNPKGFQISQYKYPISENGFIEIELEDGEKKKIRIERLHIEDDAGKLTHREDGTLCDFNRAGSPLMEIVSHADMRSSKEAKLYAEKIQNIIRFSGSSTCDMEKGMMRFDASISLRPRGEDKLYSRTEIKNLNSFRFVEEALNFEINRHKKLWEEGNPQDKEITAGFVAETKETRIMREKESASDYRYFPEPDLPPLDLTDEFINKLKEELPELPDEKKKRYLNDFKIKEEDVLNLISDPKLCDIFEEASKKSKNPTATANWILSTLIAYNKESQTNTDKIKITGENLGLMIELIDEGKISNNIAKQVFAEMYKTGKDPREIVKEEGLEQMSDQGEIETICKEVLSDLSEVVTDIRNGKDRAFGRLVGEVMKRTQGKANPNLVTEILRKWIGN